MKNKLLIALLSLITITASAKKVKLAVNMKGQIINSTGIHVYGDFQTAIGVATNWDATATPLIKETADTNIYSTVVNLPAFYAYQYKFINGDQSYEIEFVPLVSRVGFVGGVENDNRWLYIDSLANDTTFIGATKFSTNAAEGFIAMRYKVNMFSQTVAANGVHVAGSFQNWNPKSSKMYSWVNGIYDVIAYDTVGVTYNYLFYNGNTTAAAESFTGSCLTAGKRRATINGDTILPTVCYETCTVCEPLTSMNIIDEESFSVYPNPCKDKLIVNGYSLIGNTIQVVDVIGRKIIEQEFKHSSNPQIINASNLSKGIYFLIIKNEKQQTVHQVKFAVQ
jgi:Secretion system C-terminal sorting domain